MKTSSHTTLQSKDWVHNAEFNDAGDSIPTDLRIAALRRFVVVAGLLLCAFGALALWRGINPAFSNEQTIARQLEAMRKGIEKRSPGSITQYISSDCTWNGMDGKSLRAAIGQSLLQWRDVRLDFQDEGIVVRGDEAASAGRYILTVRETPDSKPETFKGSFGLQWKKRNGSWYVTQAAGGEQLPGVGNGSDPSL